MPDLPPILDAREDYPCPLCRRGRLSPLTLMEAIGCDRCGCIFETNPLKQSIRAIDRSPPLTWRWTGRHWRAARRDDIELGWEIWLGGAVFTFVPTAIVAIAAYIFPPLPGSPFSAFPIVWAGLTFFSHATCVAWLILEYYQIPIGSYLGWRRS